MKTTQSLLTSTGSESFPSAVEINSCALSFLLPIVSSCEFKHSTALDLIQLYTL